MQRRVFLLTLGGGAVACSDGGDTDGQAGGASTSTSGSNGGGTSTGSGIDPTAWNVPPLHFVQGESISLQLADHLPAEATPGGSFSLHSSSAPLPTGMTLSQGGELLLGSAAVGTTEGVVFSYEEPA